MTRCHGVVLVTTKEVGSLGIYGRSLARHLPVRTLELDAHGTSMETFDAHPLGVAALVSPLHDLRAIRTLRSQHAVLHFAHQHLARYGPPAQRPFIVTVHDLIRYRDLTDGSGLISRLNRRDAAGLRRDYEALRQAEHVVAPSQATRNDLVHLLALPEERISVVYEGIDGSRFRPSGARPVPEPYVLYVGSEQPRKNLPALLRAFAEVRAATDTSDLRLVKVGGPQSGDALSGEELRRRTEEVIRRLGLEDAVTFTGHLSEDLLAAYYTHAECLVLPSLSEGFGLPPLEAMACGCPVVVSSRGALPEVVGDAGLVVDPDDPEGLTAALRDVVTTARLRSELRRRGLDRARSFTWERAARETLEVYDLVLQARSRSRS